jgi:uncharacterized protein YndB with AHSA1/START domain
VTDQGILVELDGQPALRFERHYAQPMDRVWRAITEPDEMARWFPSNVEGERTPGAELRFVDDAQRAAAREQGEPTRDDGPEFRGRVVVFDPPKVFSFTWGPELLRFELLPAGDGTTLVFTQLLSHQSVAARNASGWHMCLGGLDALLGDAPSQDGWQDVFGDYVERMGPALGTPDGHGAMTWERSTHVDPDRVHAVATGELDEWGAGDHAGEPLDWQTEPGATGTVYRLTHAGIGDDAALAAEWHALLIQLDMYLAAGQLMPVESKPWVDAYAALLG